MPASRKAEVDAAARGHQLLQKNKYQLELDTNMPARSRSILLPDVAPEH